MLRRTRTWWNFRKILRDTSLQNLQVAPGQKDVVVVPCWRRPEFLWHCLDNLVRAQGIEDVHIVFRPDTGFSPEIPAVIHSFADRLASFEIQLAQPCPFRRTKPSANILLGCLHAAASARQYVFLVEEDIMVARDYFRWHWAVQAAGVLFCSIPVKNLNRKLTLADEPGGYYLSSGDCCSWGMCFDKRILQNLVAPHVHMAYLRRPKKYLRRRFPVSAVGLGFVEQDGLVRRIQEQSSFPIAWPCVPRAFHSGFFGARGVWQSFSPPRDIGNSLLDRVRTVANTIYDAHAMRSSMDCPDFIESCTPCNLQPPEWNVLHLIDVPMPARARPGLG